ncbi:hypothetical protein MCERH10_02689 [Caulobacteraceae bacterium]|jgi:hypothetical protein
MRRPISIFENLLFGNYIKRVKVGGIGVLIGSASWGGRSGLTGL